jgi:hypothetical protein
MTTIDVQDHDSDYDSVYVDVQVHVHVQWEGALLPRLASS